MSNKPTLTDQALFDRIAIHMIEQGQRSYDEEADGCQYHCFDRTGSRHLACAVGCTIPPEVNTSKVEGHTIGSDDRIPGMMDIDLGSGQINLLRNLQSIHDDSDNWKTESHMRTVLKDFVEKDSDYNLNMDAVNNYKRINSAWGGANNG